MLAPAGAEGKAGSLVDDAGHFYKPLQVRPVRPACTWRCNPSLSLHGAVSRAGAAQHMHPATVSGPAAPSDEARGAGERGSSMTAFGPMIARRISRILIATTSNNT